MKSRKNSLLAALASAVLITGCATHPRNVATDGLPSNHYLIGGGFSITWTAPNDGTFIVADRTSKKILLTQSVSEGGSAEFAVGEADEVKVLEKMMGIPLKDANIQAFWIPNPVKAEKE